MKVPYSSRRRVRKYFGSRIAKRRKRKIAQLATFLVLLLLIGFLFTFIRLPKKKTAGSVSVSGQKEKSKTFLVIGSEKKEKIKERCNGLIIALYNPTSQEINSFYIPPELILETGSFGIDRVESVLTGGVPLAILSVRNLLGIKIDHYFKIPAKKLEAIIASSEFSPIKDSIQSDLTLRERKAFVAKLSRVKLENSKLLSLPSQEVRIGDERFYQPDRDEIERLVVLYWGREFSVISQAPKVIILNGCGQPGIGAKAAEKLINAGFRVMDVKNANSFDYQNTIISAGVEKQKLAEEVNELLGVGLVKLEEGGGTVVDLTLILGWDFAKAVKEK